MVKTTRLTTRLGKRGNGVGPSLARGNNYHFRKRTSRNGYNNGQLIYSETGLDSMPIEEVWKKYKATSSQYVRNYLIEQYLPLVKSTAERMHMRLPQEIDVEDLMSAGLFGLMDAIEGYKINRGVKFETYGTQRIRGAIFDELRAMDWVPRLVRHRTAVLDRVRKSLENELGRKPTYAEMQRSLDLDDREFKKIRKDSNPPKIVSLQRKLYRTDSHHKEMTEGDTIKDKRQENPLTTMQRRDLKLMITKGLSRAERLIVILYYYEEMTMKEIGITLGLSESRISQMHSSILERLIAQKDRQHVYTVEDFT